MIQSVVYVYYKNNEFRCLGDYSSKIDHENYKNDGWKHTATLAAHIFIENVLNGGCEELELQIDDLSGRLK